MNFRIGILFLTLGPLLAAEKLPIPAGKAGRPAGLYFSGEPPDRGASGHRAVSGGKDGAGSRGAGYLRCAGSSGRHGREEPVGGGGRNRVSGKQQPRLLPGAGRAVPEKTGAGSSAESGQPSALPPAEPGGLSGHRSGCFGRPAGAHRRRFSSGEGESVKRSATNSRQRTSNFEKITEKQDNCPLQEDNSRRNLPLRCRFVADLVAAKNGLTKPKTTSSATKATNFCKKRFYKKGYI